MARKQETTSLPDFLGRALHVGDIIAVAQTWPTPLTIARVTRFTPKLVWYRAINQSVLDPVLPRKGEDAKQGDKMVLLDSNMAHLDDVEIYLHYKRQAEESQRALDQQVSHA